MNDVHIIRDNDGFGLFMIPLFVEWGVKRCNVEGCRERPTTIIRQDHEGERVQYGLCEAHFQQVNKPGGTRFTLVWDDFDAFKGTVPEGADDES